MTKSWSALPIGDTGVKLKAPTLKDYREQEGPKWKPPRAIAEEAALAAEIMTVVDAEGLRVPLGKRYTLWRHPHGLAVGLPSGWTVYMDLEGQVLRPGISQKMKAAAATKATVPKRPPAKK